MQVSKEDLKRVIQENRYVLFLGAGTSVEAGIPPWRESLERLATAIEMKEPAYAETMRKEIERNRYLHAAECFYMAALTDGERHEILKTIFDSKTIITARMRSLIKTRYSGIVTTNYDKSLISAATAERVTLDMFGESPDDLAAARTTRSRFYVRLHGRIEVPSSIVLSLTHYKELERHPTYASFVQSLLDNVNIVFFGFSFNDPLFEATLDTIKRVTRGYVKANGYAILGNQPHEELRKLLSSLNISTLICSPENNHAEAWTLLSMPMAIDIDLFENYSEERLRRVLASILTHLNLREDIGMKNSVLGALILASAEEHKGILSVHDLETKANETIGLPPQYEHMTRDAIKDLIRSGRIQVRDTIVNIRKSEEEKKDAIDIKRLSRGIISRASVRYGIRIKESVEYERLITEWLLKIIIADGLAIAHSLITRRMRHIGHVDELIGQSLRTFPLTERGRLEPLQPAVRSLFDTPDRDEEVILDALATICMVFCTAVTDPSMITYADSIKGRDIYLDASFVLPWICDGHPLGAIYKNVVNGFGIDCMKVPDFYLNELVSHKRLAIEEYSTGNLNDDEMFRRYLLYYRVHGVNAYIAGYAGKRAQGSNKNFAEYLSEVAPYNDEAEANVFLHKHGIDVVSTVPMDPKSKRDIFHIRGLIKESLKKINRRRDDIPIEHDAMMVSYLRDHAYDVLQSPLFITADKSLLIALADTEFAHILSSCILPYQALSLIQLGGSKIGVVSGLARAIWSVKMSDIEQLKEYYIGRVLREYEPSLAKEIPSIVGAIISKIERLERKFGTYVFEEEDVSTRIKKFRALDQFEAMFHSLMDEALEKYRDK